MKKIYSMLAIAMIGLGAMIMTSCTEDQEIGMSLEGTWVGDMYVYHEWSGHSYKTTESEVTFSSDPFRNTKGYGYWVDYYPGRRYIANHIRWEVRDREITIWFKEDGDVITISDFRINRNFFEGYIYDVDDRPIKFELSKVYDERDYDYDYWGSDYWGYYYAPRYSPAKGAQEQEGEFNMVEDAKQNEKPVRRIMRKEMVPDAE